MKSGWISVLCNLTAMKAGIQSLVHFYFSEHPLSFLDWLPRMQVAVGVIRSFCSPPSALVLLALCHWCWDAAWGPLQHCSVCVRCALGLLCVLGACSAALLCCPALLLCCSAVPPESSKPDGPACPASWAATRAFQLRTLALELYVGAGQRQETECLSLSERLGLIAFEMDNICTQNEHARAALHALTMGGGSRGIPGAARYWLAQLENCFGSSFWSVWWEAVLLGGQQSQAAANSQTSPLAQLLTCWVTLHTPGQDHPIH